MIGQRFGRLVVTSQSGTQCKKKLWLCVCDCGNTATATTGALRSGNTKSCSCYKRDLSTTHGKHNTQTYLRWQSMLNRCRQSQYAAYYGHVSVAPGWHCFETFLRDMGECPDGMTLDRIDPNGNYEPGNCRWATRATQARNTRRRKEYRFDGLSMSLIEWAERVGMPHERLRKRIRTGWSFEDAITRI